MNCKTSFSLATRAHCYGQKKRQLNSKIRLLKCSGVSQRRIAQLLHINRKTVARKLVFLGAQARRWQSQFLGTLESRLKGPIQAFHFDEMESFEHSKCLPLSIPLAVEAKTRLILSFRVCSMPAKGPLAALSRRKYGSRADHRPLAASEVFSEVAPVVSPTAKLTTDKNPKYPSWFRPHGPKLVHHAVKGRRGCVVGQGELKRGGRDPLFSLNHTAAMLRANINRLFRRTWCTTKRKERLADHIALYVQYHNQQILAEMARAI